MKSTSLLVLVALTAACGSATDPVLHTDTDDAGRDASAFVIENDGGTTDPGVDMPDAMPDAGTPEIPVEQLDPCANGDCWTSLSLDARCGTTTLSEDFSSGRYNVHQLRVSVPAGVDVTLELRGTGGALDPAVIVWNEEGETVFDGAHGVTTPDVVATAITPSIVGLRSASDQELYVFLTTWPVVRSDFREPMPTDVEYTFTIDADCEPPDDALMSPPNFDPDNVVGGYYLLPDSDPPGLYERKADACSRGNKLLIDVIYTVAYRWNVMRPQYSPISIRDMNEGSCSTVNHATHNTGVDVDIVADCATNVDCADIQPAIELATLFLDTGEVCGIIFNDSAVQNVMNLYFDENFAYEPWFGTFMRTVGSHIRHMHIRVKKPDGTCN